MLVALVALFARHLTPLAAVETRIPLRALTGDHLHLISTSCCPLPISPLIYPALNITVFDAPLLVVVVYPPPGVSSPLGHPACPLCNGRRDIRWTCSQHCRLHFLLNSTGICCLMLFGVDLDPIRQGVLQDRLLLPP